MFLSSVGYWVLLFLILFSQILFKYYFVIFPIFLIIIIWVFFFILSTLLFVNSDIFIYLKRCSKHLLLVQTFGISFQHYSIAFMKLEEFSKYSYYHAESVEGIWYIMINNHWWCCTNLFKFYADLLEDSDQSSLKSFS